jgi:hypothetical protein
MVDMRVETVGFDTNSPLMKDTYIAVRVGDSQKLCRLSRKRDFKFPQNVAGDRKFGRLDVFKRIGSASVSLKHDVGTELEEINMSLKDGDGMKFQVFLNASVGNEKPAKQNTSIALSEANAYLAEHNLEMRLSDAMQAVLREKPADPTKFIAEKLKESEGTNRKIAAGESLQEPMKLRSDDTKQVAPVLSTYEGKKSSATDSEELRSQLKKTMSQAVESGQLEKALERQFSGQKEGKKSAATDTEELRSQLKKTMSQAVESGQLEKALGQQLSNQKEGKKSAARDTEELRLHLKKTMSQAVESGQLEKALRRQLCDQTEEDLPPRGVSNEDLKLKLQATLSQAAESGQLEVVLGQQESERKAVVEETLNPQSDKTDNEELRVMFRGVLSKAVDNGQLEEALKGRFPSSTETEKVANALATTQ